MNEQTRPDPDRLLAQLQEDEARSRRGRLKVFVGANAGVGKTYAMLSSARAALREGTDVVIGVIETHGRKETAALLEGIEILPPSAIVATGRTFDEFDLDGVESYYGVLPNLEVTTTFYLGHEFREGHFRQFFS